MASKSYELSLSRAAAELKGTGFPITALRRLANPQRAQQPIQAQPRAGLIINLEENDRIFGWTDFQPVPPI